MQDMALALVLIICSYTDWKYRKIYNIVLMPALLFAIGSNLYLGGWPGLGQSLLGMLIGLLILIIPFARGGMGAGDVKLLAFVGALQGPQFVVFSAIGMGLVGGIMAIAIWTYRLGLIKTMTGIFNGLWMMLTTGFKQFSFTLTKEKIMVPYGLAIALGTAGAWLWMR